MRQVPTQHGRPTALGCHIYAGGFSLGVRQAGFELLGHLEEWKFGTLTSQKNLGVETRVGVDNWHPEEFKGRVAWLYGNPPCASFSQAGHSTGDLNRNLKRWSKDDRTKCTELLFSLVPRIEPLVFTWECVASACTNGKPFVDARAKQLQQLGYHIHLVLFNGKDLGLPQTRRRFFFVASKVELDFERPSVKPSTPRKAWACLRGDPGPQVKIRPWLKDLLRSLPRNGTKQILAKHFSQQFSSDVDLPRVAAKGYARGKVRGRPGFLHCRIALDELAPTVTGGMHLYHPTQLRTLTVLEQQLLCGYPKGYVFVGSPSDQYAQIAKAVLPPAGRWLAEQVRRGLRRPRPARPGLTEHNFLVEAPQP